MRLSREDTTWVPDRYLEKILHYTMSWKNDTVVDFFRPQVRPSIAAVYPLFVFIYGLLIVTGSAMNFATAHRILKDGLYNDPTYAFLVNIVVANIMKCIFALPTTLAVLTIQNWIFGRFMCFLLPMLQDIPFHVTTMSHLMIAVDRFRMLRDPGKPRIPAFVCSLGSWFLAVCIVIPYPVYTTYVDMEASVSPHLKGLGMCIANLDDDMQEYARALFIGTYVAPMTFTAYLHVRASRELQRQDEECPLALAMGEVRTGELLPPCRGSKDNNGTAQVRNSGSARDTVSRQVRGVRKKDDGPCPGTTSGSTAVGTRPSPSSVTQDCELDMAKEKRVHKYLVLTVSIFAACLCPLMVLRLAKLALIETYDNSWRFDATYTTFVWLAYLPTVTTPGIFVLWHMSRWGTSTESQTSSNRTFVRDSIPSATIRKSTKRHHRRKLAEDKDASVV